MDNRKFQMIANGYVCVTIDPEMICRRSGSFLKNRIRSTEERKVILDNLLKWCKNAKVGDYHICDEFTVIVVERKKKNN